MSMSGYICNITGNHVAHSKTGVIVSGLYPQVRKNTIMNNRLGVSISQSMQGVVSENSFINNSDCATFSYAIGYRLMLPFTSWLQITKWQANYWDKPFSSPKIILGTMGLLILFPGYLPHLGFPWVNFDFTPVKTPYPDLSDGGGKS